MVHVSLAELRRKLEHIERDVVLYSQQATKARKDLPKATERLRHVHGFGQVAREREVKDLWL